MLPEKTYHHALTSLITTIIDTHCVAPVYEPDEQPPLPLPGKNKIEVYFIKKEILKACNLTIEEVSKPDLKLLNSRIWSVLRSLKKNNIIKISQHKSSTTTNYYLITKP